MTSEHEGGKRKELVLQLEEMLKVFADKYFSAKSPAGSYPVAEELHQIRTAANALGIAHGRKVGPFPPMWQLFKYLENRHSNLTLTCFCEKLLSKIEKIPLGPLTRISHAIAKHQNNKSPAILKLKEMLRLLSQNEMPPIEALAGHDYFPTLKPYVSDAFKAALSKSQTMFADNKLAPHFAFLSWAAFADVWQQAKSWRPTHDPLNRLEACNAWLYSLNNVDLKTRLLAIVQANDALETCAEFRDNEKKRLERERQRKHRSKVADKVCKKA